MDFLDLEGAKKKLSKALSPPQELEVGPHSVPYLLVILNSLAKDNKSFLEAIKIHVVIV